MEKSFIDQLYQNHRSCPSCPSPQLVAEWFSNLLGTLFPDLAKKRFSNQREFELHFETLKLELDQILSRNSAEIQEDSSGLADRFFGELQNIYSLLSEDINALFDGDPAAKSKTEVVRTYPGFLAIAAHRVAHCLHHLGVRLIPRIISEYAHSKTGIDIHPAAQVGHHFVIDHGTGVVIGETTIIGNYVKVYQGVTLGALSVAKKYAEVKRHPTIGDRVVLYAGATILGGKTEVGHNSIIGGNVWLTESVPPYSKVYYKAQMTNTVGKSDTIIFKAEAE